MRLYLSAFMECAIPLERKKELIKGLPILHSFAYWKPSLEPLIDEALDIMLDSGAFTFYTKAIRGGGINSQFDPRDYAKKYATFIKQHPQIKHFIELDVEGSFGFEVYKDCLHILQDITGRQPMFVYHCWRGIEYFKELVKKADYIALGDIDTISHLGGQTEYFPYLVDLAHQNNCKVHGLAFTTWNDLEQIPFDSIDSSTWTATPRFADVFTFNGHNLWRVKYRRDEKGGLIKSNKALLEHSFAAWSAYAKFLLHQYEPVWEEDGGEKWLKELSA